MDLNKHQWVNLFHVVIVASLLVTWGTVLQAVDWNKVEPTVLRKPGLKWISQPWTLYILAVGMALAHGLYFFRKNRNRTIFERLGSA